MISDRPKRRLTLLDVMILVAATAIALAHLLERLFLRFSLMVKPLSSPGHFSHLCHGPSCYSASSDPVPAYAG